MRSERHTPCNPLWSWHGRAPSTAMRGPHPDSRCLAIPIGVAGSAHSHSRRGAADRDQRGEVAGVAAQGLILALGPLRVATSGPANLRCYRLAGGGGAMQNSVLVAWWAWRWAQCLVMAWALGLAQTSALSVRWAQRTRTTRGWVCCRRANASSLAA